MREGIKPSWSPNQSAFADGTGTPMVLDSRYCACIFGEELVKYIYMLNFLFKKNVAWSVAGFGLGGLLWGLEAYRERLFNIKC